MNRNRLVSIITPVVVILLMITAFFFGVRSLQRSSAKLSEEREKIEAEYEALHEKNIDEETGKKILTEKFLEKEYHSYYVGMKEGNKTFKNVIVIFSLTIISICAVYTVVYVLNTMRKGNNLSILRIIFSVAPIPLVLVMMFVFTHFLSGSMPPKPEEAKIVVNEVIVTDKREEIKYDDDGDKHSSYYIYIENSAGRRSVTKSMYDEVDKKGLYYLVHAEGNGLYKEFEIYSSERYIWEENR